MSEEQEQFETEETTEGIIGEQNETTELEAAPEPTEEEKAQKKINDRFAEVTRQRLEAEEETRRLKEQTESQAKELEALKAQEQVINVPELPTLSEYPDEQEVADYKAKIAQRDSLIIKKANIDAQNALKLQAQQKEQQAKQQAAFTERQNAVNQYWDRVTKSGLDEESMKAYGAVVNDAVGAVVAEDFILPHENGPQITEFLGKNPLEAEKLRGLNPFQSVSFITANIVPNLPKKTKTKPSPERQISSDPPTGGSTAKKGGRFY